MTVEERRKPEIINMSRRRRVAAGSGLKENELGQMLNEFEQMRSMFSQLGKMGGGMFGGQGGMPGMGGMPKMPGMPGMGNMPNIPTGKPARNQNLPPGAMPFGLARGSGHYRKKNKSR
jgi:signal recognition particle subunit SRP54